MKTRTWLTLGIFACLLGAVWWQSRQKPEVGITRLSFAKVKAADIDDLEIKGVDPMELTRKQGGWVLADGKRASRTASKQAVQALVSMDTTALVTDDPKRFDQFGVDAGHGTHVVAKGQGKVLADVVVGTHGAGGTFVRQGQRVFLASGFYPSVFSKTAPEWHDLHLFDDVKPADVTQVEVHLHGQPAYTLVNKGKAFAFKGKPELPPGFRFGEMAAESLARTLVGLRASTVLDKDPGAKTTGLGDGADRLDFVAGSKKGTLYLGAAAKKGMVYARVAGRDDVYTVLGDYAAMLRKQPGALRDLHLVSLDPDKVTRLELRHGKTHLVLVKAGGHWKGITGFGGKTPSDRMVTSRIMAIQAARGVAVATGAGHTGLDHPEGEAVATLAGGKQVTLRFGADTKRKDGSAAVFVRGSIDDTVYLVRPWLRDRVLGGAASFKAPKHPQFNQAMLQRLLQARAHHH